MSAETCQRQKQTFWQSIQHWRRLTTWCNPLRYIKNFIKLRLSPSTQDTWTSPFPLPDGGMTTSIIIIISGNLWRKEVEITFRNWMRRGNGLTTTRSRRWRTWQKLNWLLEHYFFPCRNTIPICPMIPTHLMCPKIGLNNYLGVEAFATKKVTVHHSEFFIFCPRNF